jgi:hypothetical protein
MLGLQNLAATKFDFCHGNIKCGKHLKTTIIHQLATV